MNKLLNTSPFVAVLCVIAIFLCSCGTTGPKRATETVLNLDNAPAVYTAGPALEITTCDSASYHWMSCDSALHPGTKFVPSDTVLSLQGERADLYNLLEITRDQELVVRDKKPAVDQVAPIKVIEETPELLEQTPAPATNDSDWDYLSDTILPWLLLAAGFLLLIGLARWTFTKDWNRNVPDRTDHSSSTSKRKVADEFKVEHTQGEGANRTETKVEMRGKTIAYGVHVNIIVDGKKTTIYIDDNMEPYEEDDEVPAGVQPPVAPAPPTPRVEQ